MEPIYRVVGSRAKCRLTPTYDQAWGLKYSKVLDLPRAAPRRAGDADRPNESEIESLSHTRQSTFTVYTLVN